MTARKEEVEQHSKGAEVGDATAEVEERLSWQMQAAIRRLLDLNATGEVPPSQAHPRQPRTKTGQGQDSVTSSNGRRFPCDASAGLGNSHHTEPRPRRKQTRSHSQVVWAASERTQQNFARRRCSQEVGYGFAGI